MKRLCIFFGLFTFSYYTYSQDSAFTFSQVASFDSIDRGHIFDRITIWCSKYFVNSNGAIRVNNRESGILSGKANVLSPYKIPKKKDSTEVYYFVDYYFDWLIEVKDNKFRFSISNPTLDKESYPVTWKVKAPYQVMFQAPSKTMLAWKLSRQYFAAHLSNMVEDMKNFVAQKVDDW